MRVCPSGPAARSHLGRPFVCGGPLHFIELRASQAAKYAAARPIRADEGERLVRGPLSCGGPLPFFICGRVLHSSHTLRLPSRSLVCHGSREVLSTIVSAPAACVGKERQLPRCFRTFSALSGGVTLYLHSSRTHRDKSRSPEHSMVTRYLSARNYFSRKPHTQGSATGRHPSVIRRSIEALPPTGRPFPFSGRRDC